ncbi:MAG: phosphoglycerate dehydrogenase [Thermoguttaceae bacterium]
MKILITSTSFGKQNPQPLDLLKSKGYEIIWNELGRPLQESELIMLLEGCDGVIAGLDHFTAPVLESVASKLKVLARYGVGVDRVDLDAAKQCGIVVTNTPTANSDSVADLAVGLMLAVARHIPAGHNATMRGEWPKLFGVTLFGKTVGLVGFGRIGRRVAERVRGFRCPVLVYDPMIDAKTASDAGVEKIESLDELLRRSDFVSLHLPATPETTHLINAERLAVMKHTAIIVNTSRGEIVDEAALLEAVQEHKIGGAGLDAYENEPPEIGKFEGIPNLVLTPHIGAYTSEALNAMGMDSAENLIAVLEGREPKNIV